MQHAIIGWFVVAGVALLGAWAWMFAQDRKIRAAAEAGDRTCPRCGKPTLAWGKAYWRKRWPAEVGYQMRCSECGAVARFLTTGETDRQTGPASSGENAQVQTAESQMFSSCGTRRTGLHPGE